MQWDFWTLSPESAHQVTFLMSDRGTPRTLAAHERLQQPHVPVGERRRREVLGQVPLQDRAGRRELHRRRGQGDGGRASPTSTSATSTRRSRKGDAPEWRLEMQIMPFADAPDYRFNPFDLTKVWPHSDYPPITIGRMVLDRNPENYFAEVEQAAFEPANMVRGIGPSPDKMLLGRLFSYPTPTATGSGPTTCSSRSTSPRSEVNSYNKDGAMRYHHNGNQPVYAPNSFGGPEADPELRRDGVGRRGRRDGPRGLHPAPRGRRLRSGRARWYREVLSDTDEANLAVEHRRSRHQRRVSRDAAARDRVLEQRRPRARREGGRRDRGSSGNGNGKATPTSVGRPNGSSASTGL